MEVVRVVTVAASQTRRKDCGWRHWHDSKQNDWLGRARALWEVWWWYVWWYYHTTTTTISPLPYCYDNATRAMTASTASAKNRKEVSHYVVTAFPPGAVLKSITCANFTSESSTVSMSCWMCLRMWKCLCLCVCMQLSCDDSVSFHVVVGCHFMSFDAYQSVPVW